MLWFRVHSLFYSHPVLLNILNRRGQTLDFITGVYASIATIATLIIMFVLIFATEGYETCVFGCMDVPQDMGWQFVVTAIATPVGQVMILLTLVYPLVPHRKQLLEKSLPGKHIYVVIRRAAIAAVICITIDWSNVFYVQLRTDDVAYSPYLVYDTYLSLNSAMLILSFADWK